MFPATDISLLQYLLINYDALVEMQQLLVLGTCGMIEDKGKYATTRLLNVFKLSQRSEM